jgi:DNA invertase Pin-like site-specific DNA recombinase
MSHAERRRRRRAAREERDARIHELHAKAYTTTQIAEAVGCSRATVYEVAHPAARELYNRRRFAYAQATG